MNSAELGQIGVTGLRGHYGFTTNEEGKNKGVFFVGSGKRCLGGGGAYPFNDRNVKFLLNGFIHNGAEP